MLDEWLTAIQVLLTPVRSGACARCAGDLMQSSLARERRLSTVLWRRRDGAVATRRCLLQCSEEGFNLTQHIGLVRQEHVVIRLRERTLLFGSVQPALDCEH